MNDCWLADAAVTSYIVTGVPSSGLKTVTALKLGFVTVPLARVPGRRMLLRSIACLLLLWNHSRPIDTPLISSCVPPTLNCSTYGRCRFGSGVSSDALPKVAGSVVKLISHAASVVKLQPSAPCAMSSLFLSFHGSPNDCTVDGLKSDASVVVAADW